jgi:hypothetical protein
LGASEIAERAAIATNVEKRGAGASQKIETLARSASQTVEIERAAAAPNGETSEADFAVESNSSDSTNVWPDEAAEAAFLGETQGSALPAAIPVAEVEEKVTNTPLPKLDDLVNRIPMETRELLDELFRAKFTTVRRVKATDLKA